MSQDWSRLVGRGPAQSACWRAVQEFRAAFEGEPPRPRCGFALEGWAARLTLAGQRDELVSLRERSSAEDALFLQVGEGWAGSLLGRAPEGPLQADGQGFAAGLLRARRTLDAATPPEVRVELAPWRDHGIGRALWFVCAGSPVPILRLVRRAEVSRQPAMWRGLGVAATYTGGGSVQGVAELVAGCGHPDELRQGASWGAALRGDRDDSLEALLPDGPVGFSGMYLGWRGAS